MSRINEAIAFSKDHYGVDTKTAIVKVREALTISAKHRACVKRADDCVTCSGLEYLDKVEQGFIIKGLHEAYILHSYLGIDIKKATKAELAELSYLEQI